MIKLKDPSYDRQIFIVTNCSVDDFRKLLKKKYPSWEDDLENDDKAIYTKILHENTQKYHHYIWIDKYKNDIESKGILAHEIMHLTFGVMENIGIKFSDDSDEAFTWYFESLFTQALKKLK